MNNSDHPPAPAGDSPTPYATSPARRSPVLVAVVNNPVDLQRAAGEGWYRIPQRRAPKRIGADYLALYQTGAFQGLPEAQTVSFYASIRRYHLLRRADLLPMEPHHPRAAEYYYRLDLGPVQRLERSIPAMTLRRVTFIHTTLDRLLTAACVRDLYVHQDPFETLWQALRESRLRPLPNRLAGETPVDIALRARGGYLGILCREGTTAQEGRPFHSPPTWTLLPISPSQIEHDLAGTLRLIGATLIDLGGSLLPSR